MSPRVVNTIAIVALAVMSVGAIWLQSTKGPRRDRAAANLQRELDRIAPPPKAIALDHPEYGKSYGRRAHSAYAYTGTSDELRAHYDRSLNAAGWRLCTSRTARHWQRDFGGWERSYVRPPYAVDIFYAGGKAEDYGWTFTVGVQSAEDNEACE